MMFDDIIKREYNDTIIEYGVMNGKRTDRLVFIKSGQNGSCYGYKNKYVRIAENIAFQYGFSVVVASNPFNGGNPLEDAMEFINEYYGAIPEKVFYMGLSNGAVIGAWHAYLYPNITNMLLVNMPIGVTYWHYTKECIENYVSNGMLDVVYGEYDLSFPYMELFDEIPGVNTHVAIGEDHNFTFSMREFLELPEKYLLYREKPLEIY